jgi:hypothetical protein
VYPKLGVPLRLYPRRGNGPADRLCCSLNLHPLAADEVRPRPVIYLGSEMANENRNGNVDVDRRPSCTRPLRRSYAMAGEFIIGLHR